MNRFAKSAETEDALKKGCFSVHTKTSANILTWAWNAVFPPYLPFDRSNFPFPSIWYHHYYYDFLSCVHFQLLCRRLNGFAKKKQQPDPIFICMLPLSFLMVMFGPYQMLFVPRFLLCSFCKFFYCSPYEFNQTKKEIDCMIMHNMWIDGTAHRRHSVWQTSFFYPIFPRQYTFRQRVNICHRARLLDIYIFFCFDLMYGYCDDVTHYLDICDS